MSKIVNTPLYNSVLEDKCVWRVENNGEYFVKCVYRLYVQELLGASYFKVGCPWHFWFGNSKFRQKLKNSFDVYAWNAFLLGWDSKTKVLIIP